MQPIFLISIGQGEYTFVLFAYTGQIIEEQLLKDLVRLENPVTLLDCISVIAKLQDYWPLSLEVGESFIAQPKLDGGHYWLRIQPLHLYS